MLKQLKMLQYLSRYIFLKYFIFLIVDGLKENCMYVSAGPRDDEKPEVVVYAEVAKKVPQSDNNFNLYADVKKSERQDTQKGLMSSEVKPKKGTTLNK